MHLAEVSWKSHELRPPRVRSGLAVIIPLLPQAAYKLLLEFLWRDQAFCYLVLPRWHPNGYISLLLTSDGEAETVQEKSKGR